METLDSAINDSDTEAGIVEAEPTDNRSSEKTDNSLHWVLLILSSVILGLSFALSVPGEKQVVLPIVKVPLPGLCVSREYLGLPCPGCGMTRCFISLAHGEFGRALRFNPAGLLLFGFFVFQVPYRFAQLWRQRTGKQPFHIGRANWFVYVFLAVMFLQWIGKVVAFFWG